MATYITNSTHTGTGLCSVEQNTMTIERVTSSTSWVIHLDNVYTPSASPQCKDTA